MTAAAPTTDISDADLCQCYRAGQSALDTLVNRHKPMVFRLVADMHLQAGVDADDLIQIGLMALMSAAAKWQDDGRSKFSSYAWTCVFNAIRRNAGEQASKACSIHKRPIDEAGGEILDLIPARDLPPLPVDVRERLGKLKPLYRRIIELRWGLDGEPLNWTQISNLTGLTVAQAKRAEQLALAQV